jgi:hypothetical protein
MNGYLAKEANDLFNEGKFQEAINKGLTFRANLSLAEKLEGAILSNVEIEEVELKDGRKALMIRSMRALAAEKAQAFTFSFNKAEVEAPVVESKLETVTA